MFLHCCRCCCHVTLRSLLVMLTFCPLGRIVSHHRPGEPFARSDPTMFSCVSKSCLCMYAGDVTYGMYVPDATTNESHRKSPIPCCSPITDATSTYSHPPTTSKVGMEDPHNHKTTTKRWNRRWCGGRVGLVGGGEWAVMLLS